MFPCHFKIPGHSGTDFKHRKAFQKSKELLTKSKRTKSMQNISQSTSYTKETYSFKKTETNKTIKWMVAVTRLSLFVLIFVLAKDIGKSLYIDLTTISSETEKIIAQRQQDDYRFLISSGNNHLNWGMLDDAQRDFVVALKIDDDGYEANLGLTKTLLTKCTQNGEYCNEAEEYYKFLKSTDNLNNRDLKDLENLYAAN